MTADLTVRFHDVLTAQEPAEWAEFLNVGQVHSLWHWSVIHNAARTFRGGLIAGTFHDGATPVGFVAARLRGLGAPRSVLAVADVECLGSSAMPGIALAGGLPGALGGRSVDLDMHRAAMHALETGLRREYGRRVQAVWYRQMYTEMLPLAMRGTSLTYQGASVAMFHNTFSDYESYTRATMSKSRRADLKRMARKFDEDPELSIVFDEKASDLDLRVVEKLMITTGDRNHKQRWPPLRVIPGPVRDALVTAPGTRVLRYTYADGRLLAAGLMYDHPYTPVHGQWGALDVHAEGGRSGLWFDQMARAMRWSIESGHSGIVGGKGLGPLKAEFGFVALPQWTVVRRLRPNM